MSSPGSDASHPAAPPQREDVAFAVAGLPGPADGEGWHRLHPVTPFLRGWKVITVLLVLVAQQGLEAFSKLARDVWPPTGMQWLYALGALVAVLIVIGGWATLSWRMTRYRVQGGVLQHEAGVFFRQQRQARLDRMQAVDVVQPLLGRIFGLAELRLEVAGGSGSEVRLRYLRDDDAQRLRNVLLAQAAGVSYVGAEAPVAPEHPLVSLPPGRLVASLMLGWGTLTGLIVLGVLAIAVAFEPGAIFPMIPMVLGVASALWARFTRGFNFTAAASPDGLRLRHGLLETRTQTVPPGRMQALEFSQPLLWRWKDWWLLRVNIAGYGPGEHEKESTSHTLMPAATRDEAFLLLAQVLPDLGTADPLLLLNQGLDTVHAGDTELAAADHASSVDGAAPREGYLRAPRRSVWLDPISWRRNGFAVTETALVLRSGRLTRRLVLVPHERTQSLGLTQGPVQRRLRLASVAAHSTPGPIAPRVDHLDLGVAARLLEAQAGRARAARARDRSDRWIARAAADHSAGVGGQTGLANEPFPSTPSIGESSVGEPSVRRPAVDGLAVDGPLLKGPALDELAVGDSSMGQSAMDESRSKRDVSDEPAVGESSMGQSAMDGSRSKEDVSNRPVADGSWSKGHVADKLASDDSSKGRPGGEPRTGFERPW